MAWIYLTLAGSLEITGVILLKLSKGLTSLKPTILCFIAGIFNFYLLSLALLTLPIGTAYGIWTGIGSAGSVIAGMFLFNESRNFKKIMFIAFIIIGVIGLKITSNH